MANFRSIYKVQVLLTILIHVVLALYEDQVGKFDWKRSFVGKVKFVSLEAKRIIVATEENVLASLNLKSGEIQWRQVLEEPKENQIEYLHVDREIFTVSGNKNSWIVRTWEINSGTLLNEWLIINNDPDLSSKFTISDGQFYFMVLHINTLEEKLLEITTYRLNSNNNDNNNRRTATTKFPVNFEDISQCVFARNYFVCQNNGILKYLDISSAISESNTHFHEVDLNSPIELIEFKNFDIPSVLLVLNNGVKLGTFIENKFVLKPYNNLMPNAISVKENNENVIYQLEGTDIKEKPIRIKAKDFQTGSDLFSLDFDYPVGLGAPIILGGDNRGSSITDLLLSTTDYALLLVRLPEGKILWTREEALASIVATEFFELPMSELDASIEHEFDDEGNIISKFSNRISTQLKQLYNLLFDNKLLQNSGMVRDEFGLHKLMIVATRAGKLFAIDTLSGLIAWSYRLPNIQPFLQLNGDEKMILLVQRTAQYTPLPAQCILLAQDSINGNGILFEFDPITGYSNKGIQRLNYQISQAILLPTAAASQKNNLKSILIISASLTAHIYPQETTKTILTKKLTSSLFLYTANGISNDLTGYSLKYSQEESIKLTPIWNLKLSPSKLIEISGKPQMERVHSQGKVLYDRSVYYKYVNPNLLAVATISDDDQIHHSVVSIYLIDGISGLVLYSTSHKKCKGPIQLVHSENWLVYSYFNERFRRVEISAIELYEGLLQSNQTMFSSFAVNQLPNIQSQSYILPALPTKLAVTLTERGITNKFLLVALSNGAIMEIPWLLLQPRFAGMPCGPEESCIPYMPEIPFHSEAIINYNQSLSRIKSIEVAPARLESTCHILVHGLDLFYTRVAPSKTFDLLKDDFDYTLIILVLFGLIIASFVVKHLAAKKALKQAWK